MIVIENIEGVAPARAPFITEPAQDRHILTDSALISAAQARSLSLEASPRGWRARQSFFCYLIICAASETSHR